MIEISGLLSISQNSCTVETLCLLYMAGPIEQGGRGGDPPLNILRILPIFPEIDQKIVKNWVILGLSAPQ